jgi:hypothetical protein
MRQTIEIPANHRLTLEIPQEIPAGKAILAFTLTPITPVPDKTAAIDPRLKGAINPALCGTIKTVGDIIGPFPDEWENGY